MRVNVGDVLFTRQGKPVLVTERNKESGGVKVDRDIDVVAQKVKSGLKNGISPANREVYDSAVEVSNAGSDYKERIDLLHGELKRLKSDKADRAIISYVEGELKHLMVKYMYQPKDLEVDPYAIS